MEAVGAGCTIFWGGLKSEERCHDYPKATASA